MPASPAAADLIEPVAEVAEWLLIGPRRVQMLVKEGVLSKPQTRGRYHLKTAVQEFNRYKDDQLKGKGYDPEAQNLDLNAEKAKHTRAAREKIELENAVRRAELIELIEVTILCADLANILRTTLTAELGRAHQDSIDRVQNAFADRIDEFAQGREPQT